MSINSFRKPVAVVATSLLLSGAGLGAAGAAASDVPAGSFATSGSGGVTAPERAAQRSALAERLGVSTERLDAAFARIRPTAPASALARQLGLDTVTVQAALEATLPTRGARTRTTA